MTEPNQRRLVYSVAPLYNVLISHLYYIDAGLSILDQLHLGVGVNSHNVVALRGLDASLGVGLTVQTVLDKEVSPLLKVDAAVIAHEAVRMVELVSGLHNGATAQKSQDGSS